MQGRQYTGLGKRREKGGGTNMDILNNGKITENNAARMQNIKTAIW